MDSATSSADLQQQMREVRQNISFHSDAMVQQARAQWERRLDWRSYVSSHPWITLAAAAAAGYLLVPRRHRCASMDAAALHRTVDKAVREAHQKAPQPASGPGLAAGLFSTMIAMLVREGLNLGSDLVREFVQDRGRSAADLDH